MIELSLKGFWYNSHLMPLFCDSTLLAHLSGEVESGQEVFIDLLWALVSSPETPFCVPMKPFKFH